MEQWTMELYKTCRSHLGLLILRNSKSSVTANLDVQLSLKRHNQLQCQV